MKAANGNKYNKYIPDIADVKKLESKFDSDGNTMEFSAEADFDAYLCALAYGSIGTELFYDAKIAYNLDGEQKNSAKFMQGMLAYSVLTKVHKAQALLDTLDFEKTHKLDLKQLNEENDYATIAFIMYYARTQGYKVEWDKISHAYVAINLDYNSSVSFKDADKVEHEELFDRVKEQLYGKTL